MFGFRVGPPSKNLNNSVANSVVSFLLTLFPEVRGDNFVGCAFDEDNQPDESEERANKWVEQIKGEGIAI